MNPSYQRKGGIWNRRNKAFLIDSILNGYDLPKFYLADLSSRDTTLNENSKLFAVIDGKQRLEAISEFFSNDLKLLDTFLFLEEADRRFGGKTLSDISAEAPHIASRFVNFHITVMRVFADNREQIEDLFVRL